MTELIARGGVFADLHRIQHQRGSYRQCCLSAGT